MSERKFILFQFTTLLFSVFVITTKVFAEEDTGTTTSSVLTSQPITFSQYPNNDDNEVSTTAIGVVPFVLGGEETDLGEFPWLANLEYKKSVNGDLVSVCAGNIINPRYLLTAAHCVMGKIEDKYGPLVSVRVGDYNTETPVDCDGFKCLDPYQRLNVESIIYHWGFGTYNGYHNYHDIALIRTDRNIQYSVSVAPIFLPDVMAQTPKLSKDSKLFVSGWGRTLEAKSSNVKLKLELPYVENSDCPFKVAPEQLCAGGEFQKDSCDGDSGGGLVRLVDNSWVIEGIVSYGRGCGLENIPGVYTRVNSYIKWINANIKP